MCAEIVPLYEEHEQGVKLLVLVDYPKQVPRI